MQVYPLLQSFFPRKLSNYFFALAGLLTYPHFGRPSHSANGTVAKYAKMLHRTYSSGSVQDFHLIPFSSDNGYIVPNQCRDKSRFFSPIMQINLFIFHVFKKNCTFAP